MLRYFNIIVKFLKYAFIQALEYKANFILGGLFEFLWVILNVIFFKALYQNTTSIAGWSVDEVLLLVFICGLVDSVHSFFFASGFIDIPNLIRQGNLDLLLLKPINKRFFLSFRLINVGQILNVIFNVVMIIIYTNKITTNLSLTNVLLFILLIISALIIVNAFYFSLSMLAFWVIKVNAIIGYSQELFTVGNKPINVYPKIIQKIFTYLIPLGVAFSYPILYLSHKLSTSSLIAGFVIAVIFFALSHVLYRRGIKKYTSATS